MRRGTGQGGYTIVETLIFLAVSGLMFIAAAVFISGKQTNAEIHQGMNDINSAVQQVAGDVSNGTYDSNGNFTCKTTLGSTNVQILSGSASQGTNGSLGTGGCTFIGKVIEFGDGPSTSTYTTFSVAGSQYANGNNGTTDPLAPTDFSSALPTVIPGLTVTKQFSYGVSVTKMFDKTPGAPCGNGNNVNAIGFFSSFNNGAADGDGSAQYVNVVPFCGIINDPSSNQASTTTNINDGSGAYYGSIKTEPNVNVVVCFDGGRGQYGSLTIGGGNTQRLTTNVHFANDAASLGC